MSCVQSSAQSFADIYIEQLGKCERQAQRHDMNNHCSYFLHDLDNDGIPELFVKSGGCEEDYVLYVFTAKNGKIKKMYKTSASHCDYRLGDRCIISVMAQSGIYMCNKIYAEEGKIKEENFFFANLWAFESDECTATFDNLPDIELYPYNDTSHITETFRH